MSSCSGWKDYCEGQYKDYMAKNCKKTCGYCQAGGGCQNLKENCGKWAAAGYCENSGTKDFLQKNCPKSCKFCWNNRCAKLEMGNNGILIMFGF